MKRNLYQILKDVYFFSKGKIKIGDIL